MQKPPKKQGNKRVLRKTPASPSGRPLPGQWLNLDSARRPATTTSRSEVVVPRVYAPLNQDLLRATVRTANTMRRADPRQALIAGTTLAGFAAGGQVSDDPLAPYIGGAVGLLVGVLIDQALS